MTGIRGPGRHRPCWPRPWTRTSRHQRPAGLLHRAHSRHTPLRLIDPQRARLPRGNKRLKHAMLLSAFASLRSAPPPRPTTNANATKTKRLGPSRPHPGPPPHPDPARHNPQRTPSTTPNQPRNYPPPLDTPHRGTLARQPGRAIKRITRPTLHINRLRPPSAEAVFL